MGYLPLKNTEAQKRRKGANLIFQVFGVCFKMVVFLLHQFLDIDILWNKLSPGVLSYAKKPTSNIVESLLFQIFQRFFLGKVWLLTIVSCLSDTNKLPVTRCTRSQRLLTLLWLNQNLKHLFWCFKLKIKQWKRFKMIVFHGVHLRQHFQSKLKTMWRYTIVNEGLWRYQTLKKHF